MTRPPLTLEQAINGFLPLHWRAVRASVTDAGMICADVTGPVTMPCRCGQPDCAGVVEGDGQGHFRAPDLAQLRAQMLPHILQSSWPEGSA